MWEGLENLKNAMELVKEFEREINKKERKAKSGKNRVKSRS